VGVVTTVLPHGSSRILLIRAAILVVKGDFRLYLPERSKCLSNSLQFRRPSFERMFVAGLAPDVVSAATHGHLNYGLSVVVA
jgi:hypothetical protein